MRLPESFHLPVSFVNFVDKANQELYRVTGGWVGGQLFKYPMLLLHTVGRKSGETRTHTLLYIRDGGRMVICGSNNGQAHYPAWYFNLQADPHARVQAGRHHYQVIAEEARDEEYARLWQRFVAMSSLYSGHRQRIDRRFPIIILNVVQEEA